MRFVDRLHVVCRAGRGGNGCLSFLREKYREFGGPDGGDGGKGGGVLLRADARVGTLLDLSYRPHLIAPDGEPGQGKKMTGASAEDLVVRVPVGTVVFRDGRPLADLRADGEQVLAARGGRGGRGNLSFKSRFNTAPRNYEKGEPGETVELDLELKLIADVGLAGFPNAGKSTFLARVSNARPKIADYPFTTLAPNLGLVSHKDNSFVLADIPGLIEGAHAGKGLGHDFLRHIERTRVVILLVDPLGYGGTGAADGVRAIEDELRRFSPALAAKPRLLAVNKQDLPEGARALASVRARYRRRRVFGVSAATGEGITALLDAAITELAGQLLSPPAPLPRGGRGVTPENAAEWTPQREAAASAWRRVKVAAGYQVEREGAGVFRVSGRFVERAAAMTDLSLMESVYRLQAAFRRIGLDRALRGAGVREGDTVRIGKLELEWSEQQLERPPKLSKKRRGA